MAGLLSRFHKKKPAQRTDCAAIIVAAGRSTRMGGIDKVLTPLGELPVLVHTLYAFQDCPEISEIIVVTREELLVEVGRLCRIYGLDKVSKVIIGGTARIRSVQAGLQEAGESCALLAVHDAARPLVTQQVIRETLEAARRTGAAAPAIPLTDTVKRVRGDLAVETVDREELRRVQTPQIFDADLIRAAVQKAVESGEEPTDECAAVERLGMKVTLTRGSRENLKLTTPLDLVLAQAILEARGRELL